MAVLFLPIAFSFCIYLAVFLRDKGSAIFKALPVALVYAAASVLIVLFTLSCVYFAPNHLRALSLEWKWSELFRAKDETSVQLIQAQLECCGLNNMHDRAWPFPAKGVDAYECERSQGWDKSCLNVWKENLIIASSLTGISSIAGFICVICISSIAGVWHLPRDAADNNIRSSSTTSLVPGHGNSYGTQDERRSMGSEVLQEHQRLSLSLPQEIGSMEHDQNQRS